MGSSRLPGKVLHPLGQARRPVIEWVVRAAQQSRLVDGVVVATTTDDADDPIAEVAYEAGADVVRGHATDVLARFTRVLDDFRAETVVRLTGDCPLQDPELISLAVATFEASDADYVNTFMPRCLPRGLDVEVVSDTALRLADAQAEGPDRSHVTSWLYRDQPRVRIITLSFHPPADDLRVTLDTIDDLNALEAIVAEIGDRAPSWREVVSLLRERPEIARLNAKVRQKNLEDG
jgi:spore coat polysaccharide biosynthesis protein SpsF